MNLMREYPTELLSTEVQVNCIENKEKIWITVFWSEEYNPDFNYEKFFRYMEYDLKTNDTFNEI